MMTASYARRILTFFYELRKPLILALVIFAVTGCETTSSDDADDTHRHSFSLFSHSYRSNGQQCVADWRKAPPLTPGLWQRVEKRYQLPNSPTNPRIVTERNWYVNHQAYLNRVSARSSRYLYYVANKLEARQLPGELALLPIVESAYNPFAVSSSQASGLWQFIPSTAKHLKMEMNWWYDARRDVPAATDTALDYLVFLRDHYDGDWLKALAAYNAGWGTIDRAVTKNKAKGLPTDYWSLDVPDETRAYVPKLLALAQISKNPAAYNVEWAYIPDLPYFAEVKFQGQLDVAFAADVADVDSDELYLLNPGISRWATPPGGPYRLLVPIDQANDLQERIASLHTSQLMPTPASNYEYTANPRVQEMEAKTSSKSSKSAKTSKSASSVSDRIYVVKSGDTLWSVAKKSGMSTDAIRKLNHLDKDEALKLGQKITLSGSAAPSGNTTKTNNPTKPDNATKTSKETKSDNQKGKSTYSVKSGDTLMAISRKYNLNVNDIARWNGINKNQAALKPGQTLTLYLDTPSKH